ncbi:hypothetical protein Tco_0688579 [Tanacetum coccineum]
MNQLLFHLYLNTKRLKKHRKAKKATEISQSSGSIPLVTDKIVIKEWEDRMERAATTASSLEAEEDNEESDEFKEIIDFLNASYVQYALMVNPTIYTTCIEQFWASAKAKIVNGERQIQALVDKKKVIITETSIRSDLKLDDAEGIDCLPTATIFAELERMGYENLTQKLTFYKAYFSSQWKFLIHTILQCLSAKTTAWNEFSSTMASAIICLATNQKFNFSKYIFDNMVKHLEGGVKFLMYPRFVQVFLDKQVEGMTRHKEVYVTPSHTKKVFANMKRPCKGFSGRVTPLFSTMMVQASEDMGEDSQIQSPGPIQFNRPKTLYIKPPGQQQVKRTPFTPLVKTSGKGYYHYSSSPPFYPRIKSWGNCKLRDRLVNSKVQVYVGKVNHPSSHLIGPNQQMRITGKRGNTPN